MDTVELFTGCGGLALGLARAGFKARRMSEWDKHSVANIEFNRSHGLSPFDQWPIHLEDVRAVRWSNYHNIDLVAGGPPCQPFSIGGLHRGQEDKRDMWPEAVRAVREIQSMIMMTMMIVERKKPRIDPARSAQMALVRGTDTEPEMIVRALVDQFRIKYKAHAVKLPGRPDLSFPRRKKVIFVHGCFWHQHQSSTCWRSRLPKTRLEFWAPKLSANQARDRKQMKALRENNWQVLVIWECQTIKSKQEILMKRIKKFLNNSNDL